MSKQTTEEIKAALDAFERDKAVEVASHDCDTWIKVYNPDWNFYECRFRPCPPKPESRKPRECWIEEKQPGWLDHSQAYCAESVFVTSPSPERKLIHFREVMPDEPQIARTEWRAEGMQIYSGPDTFIATACNHLHAATIVEAHNRAIGIKEGQA